MSYPKLTMRSVRRHPAVIKDSSELETGLDVALCYLLEPINKRIRCAQALMALTPGIEADATSKTDAMKRGFRHTPTWGIIVTDLAKVKWVNTNPGADYASFAVTRSSRVLNLEERYGYRAENVEAITDTALLLPKVPLYNHKDVRVHSYEKVVGFANLGFAEDPYKLNQFVVNLSELASKDHALEEALAKNTPQID